MAASLVREAGAGRTPSAASRLLAKWHLRSGSFSKQHYAAAIRCFSGSCRSTSTIRSHPGRTPQASCATTAKLTVGASPARHASSKNLGQSLFEIFGLAALAGGAAEVMNLPLTTKLASALLALGDITYDEAKTMTLSR